MVSSVPDQLGVTEIRYDQLLLHPLPRPEAADAEPELLAQLRAPLERRRRTAGRHDHQAPPLQGRTVSTASQASKASGPSDSGRGGGGTVTDRQDRSEADLRFVQAGLSDCLSDR